MRWIIRCSDLVTAQRSPASNVYNHRGHFIEFGNRQLSGHDLEGVVAKRLKDGYGSRVRWLKIKNPGYSQNKGWRELFDRSARALPSPRLMAGRSRRRLASPPRARPVRR